MWHNTQLLCTLQWRLDDRDGVSIHHPHGCLLNCLFRCRSKKWSKLRVTGLCVGNSPVTGEFPAQRASNAKKIHLMTSSCFFFSKTELLGQMHKLRERITHVHAPRSKWECSKHTVVYLSVHNEVIKWKHVPRYWPLVKGIGRSPVDSPRDSPHKGQWRRTLRFFFDVRQNKRLNNQSRRRWFETPSCWSWRHCNDHINQTLS